MKNLLTVGLVLVAVILMASCTRDLDPLSPGSMDGQYAFGIKALVPLAVGNNWTYNVTLYDTSGAVRTQYAYTLSVRDTVSADTSKIPGTNKRSLNRGALAWYLLQGESGSTSCWQVDSLENLRIRKSDDTRFYEQAAFNFRASLGDVTVPRYVGADTSLWASGDIIITNADSVRSTRDSIGIGMESLRTTLGSAPYFRYRQSYAVRADYVNYYFKPGFGLFLVEKFQRTAGGTMVRVRRDELVSYHFK